LLTAQRMSDKMLREANETSENQLKAASEKLEYAEEYSKSQAQLIIDDANKKSQEELFEAEKQAELITGDAERKAKQIIGDAEKQAEEILMSAKRDSLEQLEKTNKLLDAEMLSFELLKKEAAEFKGELLEKYRQHIEFIGSMLGAGDTSTPNNNNQDSTSIEEASAVSVTYTLDDVEAIEPNEPVEEEPATEEQDEMDDQDEPDSYLESEIDDIPDENDEELETEADDDEIEDVADTDEDVVVIDAVDLDKEKTANEPNDGDISNTFSQSSDPLSFFRISPEKAESEGGFPGLFTLKQTAMAQTQENSGAENVAVLEDLSTDTDAPIEFTFNSEENSSADTEEKISEETAEPSVSDENGGFKVFLDNLNDEEVLPEEPQEDLAANTEKFITVEYDEDDDDDEDDEQQPKFKGFFRK
ncbi:MAG: hypothetical protein WCN92_02415, partial [Eubacteriales bacterium]